MWALGALLSKMRVTLTWELQYYDNASDKLNGYQATNRQVASAMYTPDRAGSWDRTLFKRIRHGLTIKS